jgi:hypothetical protein
MGEKEDSLTTNTTSVQFLLEEYGQLHDLYLRQRVKRSERVSFYLGLVTAIGGAIVLAAESGVFDPLPLIYVSVTTLALLAVFGIQIHNNLVQNDINSNAYLRRKDLIRRYFVDRDEQLAAYLPYVAGKQQPSILLTARPSSIRITTQLIVAALISSIAIVAQLAFSQFIPLWRGILTAVLASGIAVSGLNLWAQAAYKKAQRRHEGEFAVHRQIYKS